MLVPTVHTPTTTNDDHKDLAAALKLLAGFECHRDAQQAHTMLVRLTESDRRDVAEDARTVLREGMRKDWFEDRKPFYQDLVALASRTGGGRKSGAANRLIIALLAGFVALALGVFLFLQQADAQMDMPYVAIAIGVLIIILAGVFALKR
jgi:hypothetical protein